MAAELPRPGVTVLQEFRSASPTVITPTLPPCVVGVSRQVVDVLVPTSGGGNVLNSEALVPLPAAFVAKAGVGTPATYAGLDGLKLVVSINNGPNLEVPFVGSSLSPKQVVAQVRSAMSTAGVSTAVAGLVGDTQWSMRSVASNEFQSIRVVTGEGGSDPGVLAAFGLGADRLYSGASFYTQDELALNQASFPDPRKNLTQLAIEPSSIRAFFYYGGVGGTLSEIRKDRAFLRGTAAKAATVVGTADISALTYGAGNGVAGQTLVVTFNDGSAPLTVTFAAPADQAAMLAQANAAFGAVATVSVDENNHLVVTSKKKGPDARIKVESTGTANGTLGVANADESGETAIRSISAGTGTASTSLLQAPGQNFTAAATAAIVTGTAALGAVPDGQTLTLSEGHGEQTLTFQGATTAGLALSQINALFGVGGGGSLTASLSGGNLRLAHQKLGVESTIKVVGGTALGTLGLEVGTTTGTAHPAQPGDELYIDGALFATISQVAPGGNVDQLKIDKQTSVSDSLGSAFHIIARGLPRAGRPTPDFTIDLTGNGVIKANAIRDVQGNPDPGGKAQVYLSYKAVRQDVSALSKSPGLLRFNDTAALSRQLAPVNPENPLALGCYFALLNAPGTQVLGLGVDATSPAAPFGTIEAFARAATFLEAYEVYGIAPLTQDNTVGDIFATHAAMMSLPDSKGERVVVFNPSKPTAKLDTLVASGLDGDSLPTPNTFNSAVANLGALLLAKGLSPVGALSVDEGLYLDVGDGKKYSISDTSGATITVRTSGFLSGENDDGYYATEDLPASLISSPFALRVRGEELMLTDGTPDKEGIALTYQEMAQGRRNRRLWQVIPEKCAALINGLEQVIEGFYLAAAIVGMVGAQPPQQSFTNFPMVGFTRALGSNDFFTEKQQNVMAAGGNYIVVQDGEGTPLIARMALTTDMTSIETRTDSITKVVDFTAKFLRRGLKNFIGRFNITQGFLDSLGHVIQGLLGFLTESGVLIGANLNNIIQDEDSPDTVLVDVTLDVPFPCNYIRLTLVI